MKRSTIVFAQYTIQLIGNYLFAGINNQSLLVKNKYSTIMKLFIKALRNLVIK